MKKASVEEGGDANEIKVAISETVEGSTNSNGSSIEKNTTSAAAETPAAAETTTATIKITSQRTRDIEKEIEINNDKHDKAVVEAAPTDTKANKLVIKKKVMNMPCLSS